MTVCVVTHAQIPSARLLLNVVVAWEARTQESLLRFLFLRVGSERIVGQAHSWCQSEPGELGKRRVEGRRSFGAHSGECYVEMILTQGR